jgi:hypothetical protein
MATLNDIVIRVQNLLGADPSLTSDEVESLAQTRYEHLYETFLWSRKLRDFVFLTVAQVTSGASDTVTVTNGSGTITSAGTPFSSAMVGRQIQLGSELQYYFVKDAPVASQITLGDGEGNESPWVGESGNGVSWRIFQTIYTLPEGADGIYSLAGQTQLIEMDGGRDTLDYNDPYRTATNTNPTHWLYAGENANGVKEIEIWPVPLANRLIRGQYIRKAPVLSTGSTIDVSVPYLTFAVAADCCGLLHAKTGDQSWATLQLFYERKSAEVWDDVKPTELTRLSLPQSLHRAPPASARYGGTDYDTSHHSDIP